MVWLDLREVYLGRVRERERRASSRDSWSEEVVVEGWVESGLVGALAGAFGCSKVMVEGEEMTGVGSVAMGTDVVASVEAMMNCCDVMVVGRFGVTVYVVGGMGRVRD